MYCKLKHCEWGNSPTGACFWDPRRCPRANENGHGEKHIQVDPAEVARKKKNAQKTEANLLRYSKHGRGMKPRWRI